MTYFDVFILSLIEGLTEFLPISSTGHLIITSALLGIEHEGFVKSFNIIIQFGAILSVLVIYWRRFLSDFAFYKKLLFAFLPAAIVGLLVKNKIDAVLDSVILVGITTFLGGFILVWSDRYFSDEKGKVKGEIDDFSWQNSLKLGFVQCLAFFPGVSRSGSTIIGGLFLGLNRKAAAEFSFFLAIPTLTGAAVVKGWSALQSIQPEQYGLLGTGLVLSFLFALISIKFMISIISKFGFKYFGYYRILVGVLIIFFYFRGHT